MTGEPSGGQTAPSPWIVRDSGEPDRSDVVALFNEVFAPNVMTPRLWDWKYADGRGVGVGAWSRDRLVAHYGGVFRDVLVFGERRLGVQITDVMVHPGERARFSKRGVYFRVASSFLGRHVGFNGTAWIGFGFPNERHYRLMELLGLGTSVGEVVELFWRAESPRLPTRMRSEYCPAAQFDAQPRSIDRLGARLAADLQNAVVGVRNGEYFRHRYVMHPARTYQVLVLCRPYLRLPVAAAVVREEPGCWKIIDFLGDLTRASEVVGAVRQAAYESAGSGVSMWISRHRAEAFSSGSDAEVRELGVFVPHGTWAAGSPPGLVENKWFLTAGDTDFL